ncbi:MAG: hypothetical protein KKA55_01955 [Proteobacteria bacterium]|nr:hypothetical protein [Pseudomonadota bacterium]MBU1594283.1 hypothetical protein [Pseudomonadota bacterium]
MDRNIVVRLRELATAQRATLAEELGLAPSPEGDVALIEATDSNGRSAILLPSTQVPQLAASLLGMWAQCEGEGRDSALAADLPHQRIVMEQLAVTVATGEVSSVGEDMLTLKLDIAGMPFFLRLPGASAMALAESIVAGLEAHSVGGDKRH